LERTMGRSTTWLIRTARLADGDGEILSVLLRLMMVVNDVGLANNAVYEWDQGQERRKQPRAAGAKLYFVRMQMAHICEALEIVDEIRKTPALKEAVEDCDYRTVRAFEKICAFIDSDDFKKIAKLRNMAAFHYDKKMPQRMLKSLSEEFPGDLSEFSMGEDTLSWYCQVADKVLDRLLMREIFEIPKGPKQVAKTSAMHARMFEMANALGDFAAHFVREYCSKNGVFT
jgi:hypothetical protein